MDEFVAYENSGQGITPKGDTVKILAIDPGPTESAFVLWDTEEHDFMEAWAFVGNKNIVSNPIIISLLNSAVTLESFDLLAIEMVQSYGHSVGRSIFETVFWIGRFRERSLIKTKLYTRTTIKGALGGCRTDKDVREAIHQRYGPSRISKGGGLPRLRKGDFLHGVHDDIWSALALAIVLEENPKLKEW